MKCNVSEVLMNFWCWKNWHCWQGWCTFDFQGGVFDGTIDDVFGGGVVDALNEVGNEVNNVGSSNRVSNGILVGTDVASRYSCVVGYIDGPNNEYNRWIFCIKIEDMKNFTILGKKLRIRNGKLFRIFEGNKVSKLEGWNDGSNVNV